LRWISILTGGIIASGLLVSLAVFAAAAAFEEALFRGYILQTFARAGLAWLAICGTALLFAVVHLNNPEANWISTTNTAVAGVWFGLAYLKTRDLWFPFGIHLMWNWAQGAVFGIEVSGLKDIVAAPLLKEIDRGPAWLTGENYGVEGGIAATIAIIISIALIYFLPVKANAETLVMTSSEKSERAVQDHL
jgi:Predicted metal-dependent membrane protease